jgi:hypothetical protein
MENKADIPEPLLAKLTPAATPLLQATRVLVRDTLPQLEESVHLGWGVIHYRKPGGSMRDLVIAISPQRAYVNLEFADGVDLPDPERKLEGAGKRARHIKVRSAADVDAPAVRALLLAAARHRGL